MTHPTCVIGGCERPAFCREWCRTHYGKWQRHGDPLYIGRTGRRVADGPPQLCSVPGCDAPAIARGLCVAHEKRRQRHGDPLLGSRPRGRVAGSPMSFLLECVLPYRGGDCVLWPFTRSWNGRGRLTVGGKSWIVSRWVCTQAHGPAPSSAYEAAHSCGRGGDGCISPSHLRWATRAENYADAVEHGTSTRGQRHGGSKLTESDVRAIRELSGEMSRQALADRFGVKRGTIDAIRARRTWRWLL